MSEADKIVALSRALNEINNTIFAKGAPLGSAEYFIIRGLCTNTLRSTGIKIEDVA